MLQLDDRWKSFLDKEIKSEEYNKLVTFIQNEYKSKTIYPPVDDLFRVFDLIEPKKVKVVIIGQDPYHGNKQANGLAFSVSKTVKIPPSLRNIYKELVTDVDCKMPANGDLTFWALQGVLLINSVLSVIDSQPNSHKNIGWETFTDTVIKKLSLEYEHIVFILWGATSQKKSVFIDETKHLVLKSAHPSPLSSYRGFFGSKPFSKANEYLKSHNKKEIKWCLTSQETLL
jgi:uracil-DNA glycosylase